MKRYIFILLVLLFCFSCKKKEQNQTQYSCDSFPASYREPIVQGMKGFFFKPNSYWIYKNDSLNQYDSVVIENAEAGCEVVGWFLGEFVPSDYYIMNYKSFPSGKTYYDCIEESSMMRNYHPNDPHWYYGWQLFYYDTTYYINSLKVGDHTFYHLQKSSSGGAWNNNGEDWTVYTALDTGIVQKISNSVVWNLVRWKINK
ncbi:MAG: hypothetical protein ABSD71_02360 [Bacteroidales bacterium]|jgi:hypothetical protein